MMIIYMCMMWHIILYYNYFPKYHIYYITMMRTEEATPINNESSQAPLPSRGPALTSRGSIHKKRIDNGSIS